MPVISARKDSQKALDSIVERGAAMAIFCTASHWNTEAILLAAKKLCDKYQIESVPLAIAMTFNYPYMPQAQRVTHCKDARLGFQSVMENLHVLCDSPDSPYKNIVVLPHLDHADPERDLWALTEGTKYLASAMFDAQRYPFERNVEMTRDYVAKYGREIMIEGIMEELVVADKHAKADVPAIDGYLEKADKYVKAPRRLLCRPRSDSSRQRGASST
jgi:fructose/tagatose bisphosphate aldolase